MPRKKISAHSRFPSKITSINVDKELMDAIDECRKGLAKPLSRSEFFRLAAIERLKECGIEVPEAAPEEEPAAPAAGEIVDAELP